MRIWGNMYEKDLLCEWCKGVEYSDRISAFLTEIDDIMVPPLKERVNIEKYSYKLARNADTIFVIKNLQDIASCSLYCDLYDAFISSIAVKQDYLNCGIGTFMLRKVIEYSRMRKCQKVMLKVYINNFRAICFYKKNRFYATEISDNWITMELKL